MTYVSIHRASSLLIKTSTVKLGNGVATDTLNIEVIDESGSLTCVTIFVGKKTALSNPTGWDNIQLINQV
jgi:hypothetical protein